jgi:microcystin-dependent protein
MTEPYIGEIQIFGFNYPPYQWAFANGQTLAVSQNTALFSLIGTYYGGNGSTTFQLPNLAARSACSQGQGPGLSLRGIGQVFGEEFVTLGISQMPGHGHSVTAFFERGAENKVGSPTTGALLGTPSAPSSTLANTAPNTSLSPNAVGVSGGSQPHENRQPLLGLNYSIALYGAYPSFG